MIQQGSFYLSQAEYAVIYVIAFMVMVEFYRTRDGVLRKIMIAYFAAVWVTFLFAAVHNTVLYYHGYFLNPDLYRVIVLMPKTVVMIWLLWYLRTRKKTDSTTINYKK